MKVIRQEVKVIVRKNQLAIVCTHESMPNHEVYAVKQWFRVVDEGPEDYFFDRCDDKTSFDEESQNEPSINEDILMPKVIKEGLCYMDNPQIMMELNGVVDIDNDNQPNEENLPSFTSEDGKENCKLPISLND